MKDSSRKCAKCKATTAQDSELVLHRFPKPGPSNMQRMAAWARYCYPDEDWNSEEFQKTLYVSHKMLCSKHFPRNAFVKDHLQRDKLHRYAVPSEHSTTATITSPTETPSPQPGTSRASVILVPTTQTAAASDVCMICLDTDSKLILMSKHKLEEAYEKLTGHPLCDHGNLKQTLCVQCAQRLINFSRFRDKSLRARALMMDLVEKHELITRRHIKMINRTKHQLTSNMVLTTLGPDHCDLHILEHPSEDKRTESEETHHRDVVKTEGSDDSMSVDGDMEVMYEDDNDVNDFVQDPLKNESAPFQCTLCLEEFVHEHEYMQHMRVHLQNGAGDGECATSQVCEPHTAVSSSHSSLITENKQADPGPSAHAAHTSVAPASTTFATSIENKVHTTKEAGAEQKVKQELKTNNDGIQNTSVDSKTFTNCEVRLFDIIKIIKVPRRDNSLTNTRKSVRCCDVQNEVPTTEYIEPVTNSSSRVKVIVSKTVQSVTDNINIQCINSSQYSSHTSQSSLICDICQKKFIRKSLLVKHMKTHSEVRRFTCKICQHKCKSHLTEHMRTHTGKKLFTCNICNRKFGRNDYLVVHMRTHTGEKPYSCALCEYKCSVKSALNKHIIIHTGEKPFTCEICNSKFARSSNLVRHMRTHTGVKPFTCKICNSKFPQKGYLVRHMRTHTGEKPYSCALCEYKCSDKSALYKHIIIHTGLKPFTCKICNSKFPQKGNLVVHMRTHTGEKPYSCALCEYKCSVKSALNKHIIIHTGEKPFTCEICNSKFARSSNLVRHMRTHTGVKPFTCKICSSKFPQKGHLVRHMRTHTGEKPYSCALCEYKCSDKSALYKHIIIHTGLKPFTCKICNSKFPQKGNLVLHMRTHTGEKPYSCALCEYKCSVKSSLNRHMKTHTGEK